MIRRKGFTTFCLFMIYACPFRLSIGIRNGIRPEPTLWSEIVQLIIVNERLNDSQVI